jgi:thiol-disulfide isomerase/thioredoxin
MAVGSTGGGSAKGSSGLFWLVIGVAGAILLIYAVRTGLGRGGDAGGGVIASGRQAAPKASFQSVSGASGSVSLASLKGKVVVLHFWATWCPPCRAEFPEFAKYAGTGGGDDVAVLPISVDQTEEPVRGYVAGLSERFPVYIDDSGAASEFVVSVIPTTIVLDKQGRVAWRAEGAADWSGSGVPAKVRKLAAE